MGIIRTSHKGWKKFSKPATAKELNGVLDVAALTGRKYDGGKDRWDLLPLGVVEDVVKVLTFGAQKYGPNNWQRVENGRERYYAALMRHLAAWRMGEAKDPETGLPHLAHAACCLGFLQWLEKAKGKRR